MQIVFVNRFYWPDEQATAQLLTDLAESLARLGHHVSVVASGPSGLELPRSADHNGVRIIRVATYRAGRPSLLKKAWDSLAFFIAAAGHLALRTRAGDLVICLTDPPLFGIAAAAIARTRRARLIHWIQDIYPEILTAVTGRRLPLALRPIRNAAWQVADACVVLGGDMAALALEAGVDPARLRVIANWAPKGLGEVSESRVTEARAERGLAKNFVVLYSGNLGRVHETSSLVALAEHLRKVPEAVLLVIGHGPQRARLEEEARSRSLSNLRFLPPQPRAQLSESLVLGHIHVVTLKSGCERLVYPSKIYGIGAVGRSLLFIGPKDCDVAASVESEGLGRSYSPQELDRAASYIAELVAQPALLKDASRSALEAHRRAGFPRALSQWEQILSSEELAGKVGTS